jgi:hypothetical protein
MMCGNGNVLQCNWLIMSNAIMKILKCVLMNDKYYINNNVYTLSCDIPVRQ